MRNYMNYIIDCAVVIIIDLISLRKNGSSRRCGLHMSQEYISYIRILEYVYCSIIQVILFFFSFLLFSTLIMIIELCECINVTS